MKNFSIVLSTVAIILAAVALLMSNKSGVSDSAIASALKNNPKIVVDALQAHQEQERLAQEQAAAEAIKQYAGEIISSENVPFTGPNDAALTVVEFFDFSCGYCKRLAPDLEKVIADNANVKFVFKPVSFVSNVSPYQAKGGMAAAKQGKFMEYYKAVMAAEGGMSEADVDKVAESIGLDMDKFKTDLNSAAVSEALSAVSSLTQKIQVNGVPSLFINGKQVYAYSAEEIQKAIDAAK